MKCFYFLLILVTIWQATLSLNCLKCDSAPSDFKCEAFGEMVECETNEGSCQTEVRYGNHNSIRINKKCKQIEACHNDKPQIYLFGSPVAVECIPGKNGEVCRCCCQRDGCNRNSSACSENSAILSAARRQINVFVENELTCPSFDAGLPLSKLQGRICSDGNKIGSSCSLRCPPPYVLFGASYIRCRKASSHVARWTDKPPCCAKSCPPHGNMDLLIAVESSLKVKQRNWRRTIILIKMILRKFLFVDMRVGLFRYSDKVDRKTAIPLDRHKNREDFIFDVDRIPAKPDETIQRSFVAALRYAHLSPLGDGTPSSKRRVLLLFANGPEKYIEQANTYARWLTDARVQVHEKLLACD